MKEAALQDQDSPSQLVKTRSNVLLKQRKSRPLSPAGESVVPTVPRPTFVSRHQPVPYLNQHATMHTQPDCLVLSLIYQRSAFAGQQPDASLMTDYICCPELLQ